MSDLNAVLEAMETAAQAVRTLPPEQWAGWVTWLLEALDDEGDPAFRACLESVRDAITTRLERGGW